jgi:hypothetical protein
MSLRTVIEDEYMSKVATQSDVEQENDKTREDSIILGLPDLIHFWI